MRKLMLRAVAACVVIVAAAGQGRGQEVADAGSNSAKPYERTSDSNGSFADSIAIAVPAFHGLEPPLALSYDSSRGNGVVGVGWKLDGLSVIERSRPHGGAPSFDDAKDVFTLDGEEMVPCTAVTAPASTPSCAAGGTHATRIESYLRIKRDTAANRWEVTNRDGTKLTYQAVGTWTTYGTGADEVRRATDFRWLLATVTDTHANTVQYGYTCDGVPDCYIDTIAYNGTTIRFHREPRPDPIWYGTGAGLGKINDRFITIDVQVGGQRLRAYKLSYLPGNATGRSQLASVQQFGKDATLDGANVVSGGTALPATTLAYSGALDAIATTPWVTQQGAYTGGWIDGDFNGDGLTDFLRGEQSVSCRFEMRIATTTGFSLQQWTVTPASGVSCYPYPFPSPNVLRSGRWVTDDFNGDGKTDVLVYDSSGGFNSYAYISTGSGFSISRWSTASFGIAQGFDGSAGDFNGDGKADYFILSLAGVQPPPNPNGNPTYPNCAGRVAISTGSEFEISGVAVPSCKFSCPSNGNIVNYRFPTVSSGDFNGDGKSDLEIARNQGSYSQECDFSAGPKSLQVYLGNTDGTFTADGAWASFGIFAISGAVPSATADLNGDGRADRIRLESNGNVTAFLSTGDKFQVQPVSVKPAGACSQCKMRIGDFDGDGASDILTVRSGPTTANFTAQFTVFSWRSGALVGRSWGTGVASSLHPMHTMEFDGDGKTDILTTWNDGGSWSASLNRSDGPVPDLLTGVTNSLGGTTTIAYTPSTAWTNTNLPFVTQTVATVTTNDGSGTQSRTDYAYAGGYWNAPERRFLGFASVTATLPQNAGEAQRPTIATSFLQNVCAYPKPLVTEEKDGAGAVLRKTEEEYSPCSPSTLPYTSLNTATTTTVYDGAAGKSAKVTRTFDRHGNVTLLTRHGDLSRTGDEVTAVTDFYPSTTAYIVNRPARTADHAGTSSAGTKLAETRTYYDGATAHTAVPTKGDATKVEQWLDGPPARYIPSTATYDSRGNVLTQSDALGNCTGFVYDTTYNLFVTETRDPLFFAPGTCNPAGGDARHKTTATWDFACGLPTETRDLNNQPTATEYDTLCRPRKVTTPGGGFSCMNYIGLGSPTTQHLETQTVPPAPETPVACSATTFTAGANLWSRTYMDGLGRTYRTSSEGPGGAQTAIEVLTTYDARGTVAGSTAPFYSGGTQYPTTWRYDALDRKIEKQHPDDSTLTQSFGLSGATNGFEKSTITDELGRPIVTHTDAYGRTVQVDEQLGATTVVMKYQYDLLGRLTDLTDHNLNQWTYVYDSLGRRTRAIDPDLGTWNYQYDDAGRLVLQTDAFSPAQRTTLGYDGLGRVLTKKAREGTPQQETTTFAYDQARATFFNVGRQTTAANAAATIEYNFDQEGRQVAQTYTLPGVTPGTYAFTTAYDTAGRVLRQTYPDGDSVGSVGTPIGYDAAGRLKSVPGLVTNTIYDARGNQTSVARGNAVTTNFSYSPERGWLLTQVTSGTAGTLQDLTFDRDALGRIVRVRSPHAGESWIYGYDDLDRLTCANGFDAPPSGTACTVSGGVADLRQTFQYDLVGNMTANSRVGAYAYPAQGPGSIRPHAVTATPLGAYQYDANGNMTVQGTDTRVYDGENRLVGATDGGTTTAFVYGPDGARLKKIANGVTTLYFGDDTEVLLGATPQYTKYLPGDAKRVGLGAANTSWLHRDHLQSVRVVTSSSGGVAFRAHYRPYGEQLATTELQPESKGFIGERHDDETGLTYLHARYYDPMLGRFVQADPTSPALPGVGVNRYAYAFNNPIGYNDPSGLAVPLVVAGVVIGLEELGLLAALGLTAAATVEEVKNPGYISRGIADAGAAVLGGDDVPVPGADLPEVNIPESAPDVVGESDVPEVGADAIGSEMNETLGGRVVGAEVPGGVGAPDVLGSDIEQGTYVLSEDQSLGKSRPYVRKSTRAAVDAAAPRTLDGRPIDPNTRKPIDGKPDLGHKAGHEHWREKLRAVEERLTRKQFNDRMNDPNKYQLEDRSSNRSHKHEQP